MRWAIVLMFLLPAACAPAEQTASPTPAASAQPAAPAAQPDRQPAISAGSVVLACTPIEDRPPPHGQVGIAQPFSILLDRNDKPIAFVGGALPTKIPFKVASIDPAAGPPNLRVGAIIRYAAKDNANEMHTELAIMKDGSYRLGLMLKTPTQSTGGAVNIGHGTCVSKPA
ncbi:MAG TPA: hypothetical protein VFC56_17130 [Stellaceae bacterium]|nr:hypothetical protein [Stellaceae bacterium]